VRLTPTLGKRWRRAIARKVCTVGLTACVYSPAGLSLMRLLGNVPLAILSFRGRTQSWHALATLLILLDLADGMIARRINNAAATRVQRHLDHEADAAMHVVLPASAVWLHPALLREERAYALLLVAAQTISTIACLLKFGCLPRYGTQAYRWTSGIAGVALAARLAGGRLRGAFHPAIVMLAAAHLEALLITLELDTFRRPVDGVWSIGVRRGPR
jgi:phosphatidylserine synthase